MCQADGLRDIMWYMRLRSLFPFFSFSSFHGQCLLGFQVALDPLRAQEHSSPGLKYSKQMNGASGSLFGKLLIVFTVVPENDHRGSLPLKAAVHRSVHSRATMTVALTETRDVLK